MKTTPPQTLSPASAATAGSAATNAAPGEDMHVEVIQDPADFAELREAWDDLCVRALAPSPTLTHEWLSAWWASFGNGAALHIVVVREGQRLLAAAPMMLAAGSRVAHSLTNVYSEIGGWILSERSDACLDALMSHFERTSGSWDRIELSAVPSGATGIERMVPKLAARHWKYLLRPQATKPVLNIETTWEDFFASRGKSFRDSVRRKVKKAAKSGVTFSIHGPTDDAGDLIDRAFSVASRSWKHAEGSAISSNAQVDGFYREMSKAAAQAGWLRLAFLEYEDKDVAFELDLDYAGARYNFKMGYDEAYRSLSPGVVLRYHVLKDAFETGVEKFHFLGERETHKDHWAGDWEPFARMTIFNRRLIPTVRYLLAGPVKEQLRKVPLLAAIKRRLTGDR